MGRSPARPLAACLLAADGMVIEFARFARHEPPKPRPKLGLSHPAALAAAAARDTLQ